jgi:16S rRNA (cytosine967-C5)-methyltransferase
MKPRPRPQKHRPKVTPAHPPAASAPGESAIVSRTVLAAMTLQEQGASLDLALSRALKDSPTLSPAARRNAVRDLHEINRRRARLTWHLEQARSRVTPHHLFAAWAGFESRTEPKGGRYSDSDQALIQRMARRAFADAAMPEAVRVECPPAFEAPLREALGADFGREMQASLEPAPVDLRVNLLKSSVAETAALLKKEGIVTQRMPLSPWGLRCANGVNVSATAAFRDGLIEFQDEGSQLAALLCAAEGGHQVLDFCAGTGGKTLAIAAVMKNKGHIVACDLSAVRLARAKQRLKRAGAENAERKQLPAVDDKWMKKHYARFDRVFVDAPCSGTGSWRRNPDARWSTQASKIDELTALQETILTRAANFVKPGGRLIYATCSLLPRENDARVAAFLASNPEFTQLDARETWAALANRPWPCGDEGVLRLSPAKHGTDGFFAAVLARAARS